jgi:hypothetical protein
MPAFFFGKTPKQECRRFSLENVEKGRARFLRKTANENQRVFL